MGLRHKAGVTLQLFEIILLYTIAVILAKYNSAKGNKDINKMEYSIECKCMPNKIYVDVDDFPRMRRLQFTKMWNFYLDEMRRKD